MELKRIDYHPSKNAAQVEKTKDFLIILRSFILRHLETNKWSWWPSLHEGFSPLFI